MTIWKGIVGASFTPAAFDGYSAKSAAGTSPISRLVKLANDLCLLYKAEGCASLTAAAKLHRCTSAYSNISDVAQATETADLAQRVAVHQAELKKEYNWDAAIAAPATAAHAFEAQLTAPQLAINTV